MKTMIFEVLRNMDDCEGRGPMRVVARFTTQGAAGTAARGLGVQGYGDADVNEVPLHTSFEDWIRTDGIEYAGWHKSLSERDRIRIVALGKLTPQEIAELGLSPERVEPQQVPAPILTPEQIEQSLKILTRRQEWQDMPVKARAMAVQCMAFRAVRRALARKDVPVRVDAETVHDLLYAMLKAVGLQHETTGPEPVMD